MTPQVTDGITLVDDMTLYEIMTKHYRWLVVQHYKRPKNTTDWLILYICSIYYR